MAGTRRLFLFMCRKPQAQRCAPSSTGNTIPRWYTRCVCMLSSTTEFLSLNQAARDSYCCIRGHVHFGIHRSISNQCRYITMLRDPVERVVSSHHYVLHTPGHPKHNEYVASGHTLRQSVECGHFLRDNDQVRFVAGVDLPFNALTDEHLEMAKRNVRDWFPVVGLAEAFDASILLMAERLGWRIPYYVKENKNPERPRVGDLDAETREAIAAHNRLDHQLYAFAQDRLAAQIEAGGAEFQRRLTAFRRRNSRDVGYLRRAIVRALRSLALR